MSVNFEAQHNFIDDNHFANRMIEWQAFFQECIGCIQYYEPIDLNRKVHHHHNINIDDDLHDGDDDGEMMQMWFNCDV